MYTAPKTGVLRAYVPGAGNDNAIVWHGDEWRTVGDNVPVLPTAWARIPDIDALPNGARMRAIIEHSETHPQAWFDAEKIASNPVYWICNQAAAAAEAAKAVRNEERVEDWRWLELHKRPPAAQGALLALLGWDDCGDMLDLPAETLRQMVLNGRCDVVYRALLLAPAVLAMAAADR